jgi:hypothetical protein
MADNSWQRRIVWVEDRRTNAVVWQVAALVKGKPIKLKRWLGRFYFVAPTEEWAVHCRVLVSHPDMPPPPFPYC